MPRKNAWDKYVEILLTVLNTAKTDDLVCVSLGPTATVLAYDIAKKAYRQNSYLKEELSDTTYTSQR